MTFALLEAQHQAYREALAAAGVDVRVLGADDALPDSVFVEDAAVVLDEVAISTRPGTASRRAEAEAIAAALPQRQHHARIEAPGHLEGGDVLRIGRSLYVGSTTRTDRNGIEQFTALVRPYGYTVVPVTVTGSLHLKTACTALDDETVLMNPAWLHRSAFAGFRVIEVCADEPFAANVLRIDDGASPPCLIANAAYPRTLERVLAHAALRDVRTLAVDISEFGKAEAGLTCMSLVFAENSPGGDAG
jgi:dimethylargininase